MTVFESIASYVDRLACLTFCAAVCLMWSAAMADGRAGDGAGDATEVPPAWLEAIGPYTHWYPDQTQLLDSPTASGVARGWRDVIGGLVFETSGVAAYWSADAVHLALITNFPDRNVLSAGRPVSPADLAFAAGLGHCGLCKRCRVCGHIPV